jgi:tetratricopeptide (TPR) repeat protein
LRDLIAGVPSPLLYLIVLLAAGGLVVAVREFGSKGVDGWKWAYKAVSKPKDALKEILAPDEVKEKRLAERIIAELDRRERQAPPTGSPSRNVGDLVGLSASSSTGGLVALKGDLGSLAGNERLLRDSAVQALANEESPAAEAAARKIAAGDLKSAVVILRRDAMGASDDAAQRWRRLGALVALIDTATALTAYEQAYKLQPMDFWTCIELARLRQTAGDLAGSKIAALAAEAAARNDRESAIVHQVIGAALNEEGDLVGATERYEQSRIVAERLARENPTSAQAQRDLSVSLGKLGDVLVQAGKLSEATTRYEDALAISDRLARENPASAQAQRDLSVSLNKLGDVLQQAGKLSEATTRYEESRVIRERLARENPSSAQAKRDLISSYWRLEMWKPALEVCEQLKSLGQLSPQDSRLLSELRAKAANHEPKSS